jgi:CubicO group peptidase (beta-lactamase class C family)
VTPSLRLDHHALDRAFVLAAEQAADGTAPWSVLGVATAAGTVRLEAYGSPNGPRIGAGAVCLIASITKPIIATAVLQLVAEGRLGLADDLRELVPALAIQGRPRITPWHVLGHTSGLHEVDPFGHLVTAPGHTLLLDVCAAPQEAMPGARFEYASGTWELLAALIEQLDEAPLEAALRRRLFEPLGMLSTTFDPRAAFGDRLVLPILREIAPAAEPALLLDGFVGLRTAGGGLWSSADDLLRFGRAMLRGGELDGARVLPPAMLELMTREITVDGLGHRDDPLDVHHYALGWGRPGPHTPGSRRAFGHGGATGTGLWIDPEHDLVVVQLTGVWGHPTGPGERLLNAVYAALR